MSGKAIALCHVVLAILPVMAVEAPFCTLEEFQGCLQSLQTQSHDLAAAHTPSQLLAVCRSLEGSVVCVDAHMKLCFTSTQRRVFNDVVAGARQVLDELCLPGPVQQVYLRHAACFRNVSSEDGRCASKYRRLIQISESVDQKNDVDEGLKQSCCAFKEFVSCKHDHVSHDCGPEAALFLQRHLDRISSPLLHEHCATYTYAQGACAADSASSVNCLSHHALVYCLLFASFLLKDRREY